MIEAPYSGPFCEEKQRPGVEGDMIHAFDSSIISMIISFLSSNIYYRDFLVPRAYKKCLNFKVRNDDVSTVNFVIFNYVYLEQRKRHDMYILLLFVCLPFF